MPRGGYIGKRKSRIERFTEKVRFAENGCWIWTGSVDADGYGKGPGDNVRAHRFSYEHHKGHIPKGMFVCHSCDTPSCVNPEHLWIGTSADNTADSTNKGRRARGEKSGVSKGSDTLVKIVKQNYALGISQDKLSAIYGISQSTISRWIRGEVRG